MVPVSREVSVETTSHRSPGIAVAVALVAAWAAIPAAAPAAGADPAPGVEALVAEALERSPSLAALRERVAAAREMVAPAGALPDPMVGLMLTDVAFPKWTVGDEDMSMLAPEVQQALPYPGKRGARRAAAAAGADVRAGELEALRREVTAQVRAVYARVWALDREREALVASRELLDMLAETVASRYAVGEGDQEAVIKAQLEVSRLGERFDDLAAERAALVAALNRVLDRPTGAPLGEVRALPAVAAPGGDWGELLEGGSPAVAVRRAEVVAAERALEAARLDLRPDFSVGAVYGYRGSMDAAVTLRFGVELPLWRGQKQEPMVRAAERELAMARAELRDAQATARAEAARLQASWERAERQVRRYREAIVPQTSAAVDAARASYVAGRGDFSTVVEDFNAWLNARARLAAREADRFMTWSELDALITPAPDAAGQEGAAR